jgi:hypothetical protein
MKCKNVRVRIRTCKNWCAYYRISLHVYIDNIEVLNRLVHDPTTKSGVDTDLSSQILKFCFKPGRFPQKFRKKIPRDNYRPGLPTLTYAHIPERPSGEA